MKVEQMYQQSDKIRQIAKLLENKHIKISLQGLLGSSVSFVVSSVFKSVSSTFFLIFNDKEKAAYYLNDLECLLGKEQVLFYPSSYKRAYQIEQTDNANVLLRSEVLNKLTSMQKPLVIVTYPEALFEKVITQKQLQQNTLQVSVGDKLSLDFINETLFEYHFKRVDFVCQPGEFSVRGGIVDVFSFSNDLPYRIEFFGDEIDSIRTFNIESQLSVQSMNKISILGNLEDKKTLEQRESILIHLPESTKIFIENTNVLENQLDSFFQKADEKYNQLIAEDGIKHLPAKELFVNGKQFLSAVENFACVQLSKPYSIEVSHEISYLILPQPSFNKQFNLLVDNLMDNQENGIRNLVFCSNETQANRLRDIFSALQEEKSQKVDCQTINQTLYQGFIDQELQLACYTDHQIFERYHKFQIKNGYTNKAAISLQELTSLTVGDYVTHIDHGIGKFGGLQKIQVDGKTQEAIKLVYADNDIVYVNIHALHKIAKFNGKDGSVPKIHKLGSTAWKTLKQKTKARVKHVAFNLIELYAKRRAIKGFSCAADSYLQAELESSFVYEDTPDQSKATAEVKADMESDRPMDRLVCGDVGFGKTEVAIRAAFKMVDNGKQVAVLVPTTLLAFQHFRTFSERLKEMPVKVAYLNRFKTAKQKAETLKQLADGSIDIVVGTHQLVNKNVVFKDLGLLVVDEEQKFGVAVKDKLKTMAATIDTLTLTATPIPRTLQFSLMAARDLSVITTPPPNRYPIESQVIGFNEEIIRDAISYEIERGGQVYFINNRIENSKEVAGMIQRLVPQAKVALGNGQMEGKQLEELMLHFMEGAFDVLVATTIVESGLDVPNANTIFINNANNFGLSDLHQMRGRVGRSNKKAFCYFICPPYSAMTEQARKRIGALEQFSELGSGFNIAMKDLEIRGAGDLLGGEQSGFINEIGFETYQKIMNEAIEELKENEFKELYHEQQNIQDKVYVKELVLESDFEMLFPDLYINSVSERLNLYNQLNTLTNESDLVSYQEKLQDRFGALPQQAINLLDSVRIKWLATDLGIEKLFLKQGKMIGYFLADQQSDFYQTDKFQKVLLFVQQAKELVQLKEKQTKNGLRLILTFEKVTSVCKALDFMKKMHQS